MSEHQHHDPLTWDSSDADPMADLRSWWETYSRPAPCPPRYSWERHLEHWRQRWQQQTGDNMARASDHAHTVRVPGYEPGRSWSAAMQGPEPPQLSEHEKLRRFYEEMMRRYGGDGSTVQLAEDLQLPLPLPDDVVFVRIDAMFRRTTATTPEEIEEWLQERWESSPPCGLPDGYYENAEPTVKVRSVHSGLPQDTSLDEMSAKIDRDALQAHQQAHQRNNTT